jgi:Na+-driven multidrug efflux pump
MDEHSETKKTLKTALRLSSRVGLGFSIFIITLSNMMLKLLIGNNSVGSEVMGAAQKYVWVRALSMPAAAMIGSAQAACLAMQDVKSPLLITLVAAVINLVGDLVLVPHKNPWVGGAAGAAW